MRVLTNDADRLVVKWFNLNHIKSWLEPSEILNALVELSKITWNETYSWSRGHRPNLIIWRLEKKTHHNLVEITKLYSAYYSKFVLVSVIISIQVLSAFLSLIKNTSWLIKSYSWEKIMIKFLNNWILNFINYKSD